MCTLIAGERPRELHASGGVSRYRHGPSREVNARSKRSSRAVQEIHAAADQHGASDAAHRVAQGRGRAVVIGEQIGGQIQDRGRGPAGEMLRAQR